MIDLEYIIVLLLWPFGLAFLLYREWYKRPPGVGLVSAFYINLMIIHFVAGLIQLLPWHHNPERYATIIGFKATGVAVLGLVVGCLAASPIVWTRVKRASRHYGVSLRAAHDAHAWPYVVVGLFVFLVIRVVASQVPSGRAIFSAGISLAIAGAGAHWWSRYTAGRNQQAASFLLGMSLLPPLLLVTGGFLGAAILALVPFAMFIACFLRSKKTVLAVGAVTVFFGLSLYPSYMSVRSVIRGAVWGNASMLERIQITTTSLLDEWRWFNPWDEHMLDRIEERLNQNIYLGVAVDSMTASDFANGETIIDAFYALVPRILWPDKPIRAGGSELVTRFTGIRFQGASVAMGLPMEFYCNFGFVGMFLGFFLLGAVLECNNILAWTFLVEGKFAQFYLCYVPSVGICVSCSNLAEITASAAGALVLTASVNFVLQRRRGYVSYSVTVPDTTVVTARGGGAIAPRYPVAARRQ